MAIRLDKIPNKIKVPSSRELFVEVERAMDDWSRIVQNQYRATTRTWSQQPVFFKKKTGGRSAGYLQVQIYTGSKRYYWIDQGTNPYPIAARRRPTLAYQANYRRATRPRVLGSRSRHGKYGPWVRPKRVVHSGIEARHFTNEIAKRHRNTLVRNVNRAIMREFRRQGNYG